MQRIVVNTDCGTQSISRHIYGHFAEHLGRCIYDGIWVGEDSPIPNTRGIRDDIVEALRALNIPNLRWPGGCFADEYHWMDGIGPRSERPSMVNTHWGGVTESNHFGTHEFMDLCDQLGCEPYICGNLGSGTVREMQQWIEYITADEGPMADLRRENGRDEPWRIQYWGVGNENWGCGGAMRPEYYADEYRRYSIYCRNFGENYLYKIACGPNVDDYRWTEVLMRQAAPLMNGLSLHYYTIDEEPGQPRRRACDFDETGWARMLRNTLRMDELIQGHSAVMDQHDPARRVGLMVDEWGAWHGVEEETNPGFLYQQNTMRDAMVAALTLHVFHNHCGRVQMANIAQTINVLQSMVLTQGEKMLLTPTYHVFEMLKGHQDATLLPLHAEVGDYTCGGVTLPGVSASASRREGGPVTISLANVDPNNAVEVSIDLRGDDFDSISGRVLTAATMDGHNTFDQTGAVAPARFDEATLKDHGLTVQMPAMSVVVLEVA